MLRRALVGIGLTVLVFSAFGAGEAEERPRPFTFTSITGVEYSSWQLLGKPLVVTTGSHF